jgi:Resolvase, N terminal domain
MHYSRLRSVGSSISWSVGVSTASGRSLRHLILLLDELQAPGVAFVSLAEGIDATTPAGRLQLHVLGAIAEFERERIRERVRAGLAARGTSPDFHAADSAMRNPRFDGV